jgi:hypothetical protein
MDVAALSRSEIRSTGCLQFLNSQILNKCLLIRLAADKLVRSGWMNFPDGMNEMNT